MIDQLFSTEDFDKFLSVNIEFSNELLKSPIGLIDIGARGGVSSIFKPASKLFNVLGFEPDPAEVMKIKNDLGEKSSWADILLESIAVSDKSGIEEIYLLKHQVNSSMYPVNENIFRRYKLDGFQLEKKIKINVDTIDNLVFSERMANKNYGEILKIDTQGAELKILQGAERTLEERTTCILCEAAFFTPYENVTLFSELEIFLRNKGFTFYAFLDFQQRSTKRMDKFEKIGRERFMQADALFFKDPLHTNKKFNGRYQSLIVAALLFGYYDFALEIVESFVEKNYKYSLSTEIKKLAEVTARKAVSVADNILQMGNVEFNEKLLALGKAVDYMRDFHTFHEIKN